MCIYFIEKCISPTVFEPPGFNFAYFGSWAWRSYVKMQLTEHVSLAGQGGALLSALLSLGMEQQESFPA